MIFPTVKDVIAETVLSFDTGYLKTGANFYAVDAEFSHKIFVRVFGKAVYKGKNDNLRIGLTGTNLV